MKQRSLFVVPIAAISLFTVGTFATALVSSTSATTQSPKHAIPTHEKRLKGSGDAGARKPRARNVVEAKGQDWKRDPFKLIEENGRFYARGAGGSIAHGVNERMPVKSLYEAHEFQYR